MRVTRIGAAFVVATVAALLAVAIPPALADGVPEGGPSANGGGQTAVFTFGFGAGTVGPSASNTCVNNCTGSVDVRFTGSSGAHDFGDVCGLQVAVQVTGDAIIPLARIIFVMDKNSTDYNASPLFHTAGLFVADRDSPEGTDIVGFAAGFGGPLFCGDFSGVEPNPHDVLQGTVEVTPAA